MASSLIRPDIAALKAYHVAPAEGLIKLDAMENPYDFPDHLRAPLQARLEHASLNRYPDANARELKAAIRHAMQVPDALDILLGNGSDEIIQIIAMTLAKPGATLLSVEPAFVMFRMIAMFCAMKYVGVPLTADFAIDRDATLAAIHTHQPAVIFIAYPNNPSGNLFDRNTINDIIAAAPGLVVIDEAYFAFAAQNYLQEIMAHQNVVLMRTVSKLGLAGLRLGMLFGRAEWLNEFEKVRLPYNINTLTQAAAIFALKHSAEFQVQTEAIVRARTAMAQSLAQLLTAHPTAKQFASEANFILLRLPYTHQADAVFTHLLSKRVLVKNTSAAHPLLANTLRITIGNDAENRACLTALTEALS